MENNEKFATFFGEASKGRKMGAVFAWIAAAVLLAALFVPAFGIGYAEESKEPQASISSQVSSSDAKTLVNELEESDASLVGYLTNYAAGITTINTGEKTGSALNIVLLVVYVLLVIATAVLALYTMNVLSLVTTVAAVAEVLVLYFVSFSGKVDALLLNFGVTSGKPTLNLIMIIVLVVAVVLQIVGVILTYAVKADKEDDDYGDYENDEERNADTGLFDETNHVTMAQSVAASLVQMNTGKAFSIPEGTELVIGKGSQANIIVSNPIISRAHAKISVHGGVCTIQDLGSKNGTFVGDQRLPNGGSAIVPNGAYITLGNEIFQVNF